MKKVIFFFFRNIIWKKLIIWNGLIFFKGRLDFISSEYRLTNYVSCIESDLSIYIYILYKFFLQMQALKVILDISIRFQFSFIYFFLKIFILFYFILDNSITVGETEKNLNPKRLKWKCQKVLVELCLWPFGNVNRIGFGNWGSVKCQMTLILVFYSNVSLT